MAPLRVTITAAWVSILAALLPGELAAQVYPAKPIRIVVPTSPGGATDVVTRLFAPRFSERIGQPVVIENRPGGDNVIGTAFVARSPPDGYTLLSVFDNFPLNQLLRKDVPYDALKDFEPIALVVTGTQVLVVPATSGIKDMDHFLRVMRAKGSAANYATAGVGSSSHLAVELFKLASGIAPVSIHMKGGAPAITELVAGRVDMMMISLGGNPYAQIKAGRLVPLAFASANRHREFQDIPTVAEYFPGFGAGAWIGLVAPARTPNSIVSQLSAAIVATLRDPDIEGKLAAQQFEVVASTPEAFAKWLAAEHDKWGKVVREQRITVE
jgi:tripartite-type tricarboxylate transporter receptor subunit TctC